MKRQEPDVRLVLGVVGGAAAGLLAYEMIARLPELREYFASGPGGITDPGPPTFWGAVLGTWAPQWILSQGAKVVL